MGHCEARETVTIGVGVAISIVVLTGLVMQAIGYKGEIVCDLKRPDGTPHTPVDVPKTSKPGRGSGMLRVDGVRDTYL
jgi:GDP-L-fucose synthase